MSIAFVAGGAECPQTAAQVRPQEEGEAQGKHRGVWWTPPK